MHQVVAGRYRVLRELGRGGMGVVYVVEHLGTGDRLALKLLLDHKGASAELIERFKREARAPARIRSEHVVKVTDTDVAPELGGAPFIVMELLDGTDLEKVVAAGPLPGARVVDLLRQAAVALDKAHAMGIVHRDLKPENLFLHRRESGEEILKILDFGISKMRHDGIAEAGLTQSGAMMGTPLYMSPEQARGRVAEIGPGTDVWAIGLITFRLLTGTVYWTAHTLAELMVQIISEPMEPPSQRASWLPAGFDAWFARSTQRDVAYRFGSVGEQVEALATVMSAEISFGPSPVLGRTVDWQPTQVNKTASPLVSSQIASPPTRSRAWAVALLAIVVGVLGGVAVFQRTGTGAQITVEEQTKKPVVETPPHPVVVESVAPAASVASAPSVSASAAKAKASTSSVLKTSSSAPTKLAPAISSAKEPKGSFDPNSP